MSIKMNHDSPRDSSGQRLPNSKKAVPESLSREATSVSLANMAGWTYALAGLTLGLHASGRTWMCCALRLGSSCKRMSRRLTNLARLLGVLLLPLMSSCWPMLHCPPENELFNGQEGSGTKTVLTCPWLHSSVSHVNDIPSWRSYARWEFVNFPMTPQEKQRLLITGFFKIPILATT